MSDQEDQIARVYAELKDGTFLMVFLAMLWLVILDSNLVEAARVGDVMPLLSLLPAFAPAVLLPPLWIFGRFFPGKRA